MDFGIALLYVLVLWLSSKNRLLPKCCMGGALEPIPFADEPVRVGQQPEKAYVIFLKHGGLI